MEIEELPLFDPARIDELRKDLGAPTLRQLLAQCLNSMRHYLSEIERCTTAGDCSRAKRAAHDLKGICAQFGAARASEIARRIELDLEDVPAIARVFADLAASVHDADGQITEIQHGL